MKFLILTIATFLGYLSILVCSTWSIISFILYLVKDTPFQWEVLWSGVAAIPITIGLAILTVISKTEEPIKRKSNSRFQQRMDEMKADKLG